jgi:D-amino-acid oxidase
VGHTVLVLGAGVSGLTCALALAGRGRRVRVVAERRTPRTTSDRSAAAFTPFRLEGDPRFEAWTREAYRAFAVLAREHPTSGVRMALLRELVVEGDVRDPWWSGLVEGYERIPAPPAGYRAGYAARMPLIDMTRYMPWLERRLAELGVPIEERRVESLDELSREAALVVDCAGLGARELCDDRALVPARGQVLHAPNDLGLDEAFADAGGAALTYLFPFRDHVVLGGTFEPGVERAAVVPSALEGVVARCRALLAALGHPRARALAACPTKALAGLRPCREGPGTLEAVRLEREELGPGRCVVHDYGHGRAGVTLSWGCAAEVARLVEEVVGPWPTAR